MHHGTSSRVRGRVRGSGTCISGRAFPASGFPDSTDRDRARGYMKRFVFRGTASPPKSSTTQSGIQAYPFRRVPTGPGSWGGDLWVFLVPAENPSEFESVGFHPKVGSKPAHFQAKMSLWCYWRVQVHAPRPTQEGNERETRWVPLAQLPTLKPNSEGIDTSLGPNTRDLAINHPEGADPLLVRSAAPSQPKVQSRSAGGGHDEEPQRPTQAAFSEERLRCGADRHVG